MAKKQSQDTKKTSTKNEIPIKGAVGINKALPAQKKGKHVSSGADEIDDIFNKKKITDGSEIDDIFNNKKIKSVATEKEPVLSKNAKRKAAKKSKSTEPHKEQDQQQQQEEQEEELSEEQFKKVEEVIFAELAAVKSSKTSKKRAAPPSIPDDAFADSRGIKKTNRTTEDGYPLYDVKDLNIGNGLDTPDCPFDCQCCF
ncbi:hypothetical protein [Parasitella parasitica]|uniref:DUF1764 domain-containing protein n=1 Tax=Parasitella parasitica TaxID=35722 RepID=A0A0B7MYN8_9FUNG|nr:hypothetical protein [Parasitella parasitica]